MVHDEHDALRLPPGDYEVRRQREYVPKAPREHAPKRPRYRYVAD